MNPKPEPQPFAWQEMWRAGDILIQLLAQMLLAMFSTGRLSLAFLLPTIAALIHGIGRRSAAWLTPAGVLGGIALGVLLLDDSGWLVACPQFDRNGLHLIAQGLGWLSITGLTRRFTARTQFWPLIPGLLLILAAIFLLLDRLLVGNSTSGF